jgi:hypothetical protein
MKALVPAGTYAVCTNGMRMGEVIVTSQTTIKNQKGDLLATIADKPTNFMCVWAGIIAAAVAAFLLALAATLGPLAVIIIAALIGAFGSVTLGSLMCYLCLKCCPWLPNSGHSNIRIAGNQALLSSAKTVCTPLGFLPSGSIMLCYDKSVARRSATMYAISNSLKIFEGAVFGAGVAGICSIMKGVFGMYTGALEGMVAAIGTGSILVGAGYTIGSGTSKTQEWASNKIADWSTDGEYGELEEKEAGEGGSDDTVLNLESGVSTQPGDFRVIPAYRDEAELKRLYKVGMQATGEVFDESWKRIKADPDYNKKGISKEEKNAVRNKHMKEVAKDLFERNKKLARNEGFWKDVNRGVKDFFILNLACIGINIAGETAFKISKVALERVRNLEAEAQSKVGIYEIKLYF